MKTGLHVVGFGAPTKSHFLMQAHCVIFELFLPSAAVVEVAVALLIHRTIPQSP